MIRVIPLARKTSNKSLSQWVRKPLVRKISNKSLSQWVRKPLVRKIDRKTQGRSLYRYVRRVINRSTFIEEKLNNLEKEYGTQKEKDNAHILAGLFGAGVVILVVLCVMP